MTRAELQRLFLEMLLMNHPLLAEVDIDRRFQDQDSTVRLLQPLPKLQCLGLPLSELLLSVLVERFRQRSTLQIM